MSAKALTIAAIGIAAAILIATGATLLFRYLGRSKAYSTTAPAARPPAWPGVTSSEK